MDGMGVEISGHVHCRLVIFRQGKGAVRDPLAHSSLPSLRPPHPPAHPARPRRHNQRLALTAAVAVLVSHPPPPLPLPPTNQTDNQTNLTIRT